MEHECLHVSHFLLMGNSWVQPYDRVTSLGVQAAITHSAHECRKFNHCVTSLSPRLLGVTFFHKIPLPVSGKNPSGIFINIHALILLLLHNASWHNTKKYIMELWRLPDQTDLFFQVQTGRMSAHWRPLGERETD